MVVTELLAVTIAMPSLNMPSVTSWQKETAVL